MNPIITKEQIAAFKQLTVHMNEVKLLNQYIVEAQEFDLRPFLGDALYMAVVEDYEASPSLQDYSDLYNGSTYTYNSKTYKHEGIVSILSYYSYARYLSDANVKSTATGMRVKINEFSEPVSPQDISRMMSQARSGGVVYQERVKLFLDRNYEDYPLWEIGHSKGRRSGGIRISAVGGTNSSCKYCGYHYNYCRCR